jgi:hypothetical protein
MVHDADAAGEPVEVMLPVKLRVLQRGFLRLLADTRRCHTMQVSALVAAGLRAPMDEPVEEGQTFNLALEFDRFGRGELSPSACAFQRNRASLRNSEQGSGPDGQGVRAATRTKRDRRDISAQEEPRDSSNISPWRVLTRLQQADRHYIYNDAGLPTQFVRELRMVLKSSAAS